MDVPFYDWALRKFVEMQGIDDPNRTTMSMFKGILESDQPDDIKIARIKGLIKAFDATS